MPLIRPLATDGTAPSRITAYIAELVMPSQMIAAGTQATEGSDCRPDRTGPSAARTGLIRATIRPIGVPMATESTKPDRPRQTLVQMIENSVPAYQSSVSEFQTSAGLGSLSGVVRS